MAAKQASASSLQLQWPQEVITMYEPVQVLGRGGFGCVYMGKDKTSSSDIYVAIKVVGNDAYAKREASILSELTTYSHPHIVKLFGCYKPKLNESSKTCLVLSLARGPTLNRVLEKGGALSLLMAKTISRQLLNAVAFLHGHAVIHRDIQPHNIIVSGSSIEDHLWWSDKLDVDGIVSGYIQKCKITIIDFGFARALSPDDLRTDVGLDKAVKESAMQSKSRADVEHYNSKDNDALCVNDKIHDTSIHNKTTNARGRSITRNSFNLDSSQSHKRVRDLSALGTRNYAAPEIMSGLRKVSSYISLNSSSHSKSNLSSSKASNKTAKERRALAECVSSYGMVADSFSAGATIRYMVTGVPPQYNVDEYIASKNNPLKTIINAVKRRRSKNPKLVKHYRSSDELPNDAKDLIRQLTHYDSRKRATVRYAASHPWVWDDSESSVDCQTQSDVLLLSHGGPITFLKCSTANDDADEEHDSL